MNFKYKLNPYLNMIKKCHHKTINVEQGLWMWAFCPFHTPLGFLKV